MEETKGRLTPRQRYHTKDPDRVHEAMGYLLAEVSRLAAGEEYPLKDPRRWARGVLADMTAEGYIEPRPAEGPTP